MWESVGNYGHSALHRLALERRARGASAAEPADGGAEDGRPERFELPAALFAEGLACLPGDRLLQLTWREGVVLEFETRPRLAHARTRALGSEFRGAAAAGAGAPRRPREMWGAAFFPAPAAPSGEVAVSNGSSVLAFLDARTLAVRRTVRVHDRRLGVWVEGLNELEVVEGEVWANVYPMYQRRASRCVARVEPRTGEVLGWLDLSGLAEAQPEAVRLYPDHYVLNGIAYNASRDGAVEPAAGGRHRHRELYVTGKHWDRIYQIQLGTDARTDDEAVAHVRRACNLYLGATYPAGGATGGQSQANPAGGGRRGGKRALGQ
jgi:glutamine cyclotransferase